MNGETWARVSLRIVSPSLTIQEIDQLLSRTSSARQGNLWAVDLTADSAVALNEQLQIAKDYLQSKAGVLEEMTDSEVNLSIGWTPRSPQDGIVMDAEMIALMSRIRCYVLLDTYLD
ncbi:hypothetical protein GCM10010532_024960 [Dactylosporangium siamense]|uniref:DUF4279 domain-containing protein n=1 Tax=Dactylosporangium siamense TaxID=685454 RepID=A0A919UD45_9ACTN|nr:hypothetical protein Dsi01nite_091700 [Dactylosporangium siamense]